MSSSIEVPSSIAPHRPATCTHVRDRSTVRVRVFEVGDWPRLCVIHDRARRLELRACGANAGFQPLTYSYASGHGGLFEAVLLVVERDGVVVAFVSAGNGRIAWLYVDPDYHGQGIGRELVRLALRLWPGPVELEILVGNSVAERLYASEGFSVVNKYNGTIGLAPEVPVEVLVMRYGGAKPVSGGP